MTSVEEAVTGTQLRTFMRSWATGVAVVTSSQVGTPVGCTVNAFTSISLSSPLLLISLAETSRTLTAITACEAFGVNLLSARQRRLAERFATGLGDRFAGVPYRMVCGVPVLTGAMAVAACEVVQTTSLADHVLLFGRPLWLGPVTTTDPVVFFGGRYRALSSG
jgi:flavin reductase (DIM6/NTAB) family NADH-FMN oxidoreductase RutF